MGCCWWSKTSFNSTTACAFIGDTNRLLFATAGDGTDGKVYIESASTLISGGYIRTGFIRYNTTENKIFKIMQTRADNTYGAVSVDSITADDTYYRIGSFGQATAISDVNISFPTGSVEYLGFQFNFTRSTTDTTKGPLFTGYQVKSLPAVPRQRLIQYPVMCYDHEKDHYGVELGYEGSAYDRISQLETIENLGDTIRVEDFRTGESYLGLIEEEVTAEVPAEEQTMAVDPVADAEAILAIVKPAMDEQMNALLAMIADLKNQLEEALSVEVEEEVMSEGVTLSAHQRFSSVNKFINNK